MSPRLLPLPVFCLVLVAAGCGRTASESAAEPTRPSSEAQVSALTVSKQVLVGNNVWFEKQGDQRRVLVAATVCLREGFLEEFLCRKGTKEHESILTADVDARDIHKALLLTGIEPGSPVQFQPTFKAATGPRIKVSVRYEQAGKLVTVRANEWVRNQQTKKELEHNWVFTGSVLVDNPLAKGVAPTYLANGGDFISLSNFEGSLLDLPFKSSQEDAELVFEAFTERIPLEKTAVTVVLEPLPKDS